MAYSPHWPSDQDGLERWEQDFIRSVAASFDTRDREDLEAELAWRLLVLKRRRDPAIRNWRAYVYTFLRNKALNWVRRTRPRERQTTSLDAPLASDSDAVHTLADLLQSHEIDEDRRLALTLAVNELSPELQRVLRTLIEEEWNQTKVAVRLHKHRNTIRGLIRRIRQTLAAHGLGPEHKAIHPRSASDASKSSPSPRVPRPTRFLAISRRCLAALVALGLNGTEWRVALWVIRQCSFRKQRTVSFTWRGIANALAADHAGVNRAGYNLLRMRLLFTDRKRIGFECKYGRWRTERMPELRRFSSEDVDK